MKAPRIVGLLSSLLLCLQADGRTLLLEDSLALEQLSEPQISPDGKTIVYQRSWIDIREDRHQSEWWTMDADGGRKRRLMIEGNAVRWSPESSRIAYISTTNDGAAIFVTWMDARGGTARLTRHGPKPERLFWSPDGRWIAFTAKVPEVQTWTIALPGKPADARWVGEATVIDKLHNRIDGVGHNAGYVHLFIVSAEGGIVRQLTRGDWHAEPRKAGLPLFARGDLEWTPDSRSIVFGADLRPDSDDAYARASLNIVDVADGQIRTLAGKEGFWGVSAGPRVSPDGKRVAYVGERAPHSSFFSPFELRVVDVDGSNDRVILQDISSFVDYLHWAPDSRALYYVVDKEGGRNVQSVSLLGKTTPVSVAKGTQSISLSSTSGSGSAAGTLTSAYNTGSIVRVSLHDGDLRVLTSVNTELLGEVQLGRTEELWYDSSDHARVQAWIVYPPGFDVRRKYPLVLQIHGGPAVMRDGSFSFDAQALAAAGYVVLTPNYRGSTGYGLAFAQQIYDAFPGNSAYADLMSGVDAVLERGFIDDSQMYVMGHSAGGTLATWVITQTGRFAAAVIMSPVVNHISMAGTSDVPSWVFNGFKRSFWEDASAWLAHSSILHIDKVTTPTLIIVGENDLRTPVGQSQELFTGLKRIGVPARLVLLKDEGHDVTATPSNMLRTHLYTQKWLKEWSRTAP